MILFQPLTLSGSQSMNVNGSVTPQTFSYTLSARSKLLYISILLRDEGTTSLSSFGAISALTNGLAIQLVKASTPTTIATVKSNADLCNCCDGNYFGNGAVIVNALGVAVAQGFGASNNIFSGYLDLDTQMGVFLDSGDKVQAIVQDNLSAVDFLQMFVVLEQD